MNTNAKTKNKKCERRETRQRGAIRQVFCKIHRPLSAGEVLEHAQSYVPSLNQATVYRTLKMLSDDGWLTQVPHVDAGVLYERSGKDHHHHFYCRDCNRLFELAGCALPDGGQAPPGFVIEGHELFVNGLCQECAESAGHTGMKT